MTVDPVRGFSSYPLSWNAYAYARNNPLRLFDPTGMLSAQAQKQGEEGEDTCTTDSEDPDCQTPSPGPTPSPKPPSPPPPPAGLPPHPGQPATLDELQVILDSAGFVPGIGEVADGASGVISLFRGDFGGAALSLAAMIPTGGQAAGAAKLGRRFTPHQAALIDLAQEARKRGGLTREQGQILREWAQEYKVRFRGPEVHPGRPVGQYPHYHVGPVDHIPLREP